MSHFSRKILILKEFPGTLSQEKAVKWYSEEDIDGLTTNGVFVMKPINGFTPSGKPGVWREISVGGNVFSLRESRPMPHKSHQVCYTVVICSFAKLF